jgi:hypothetical protein
MKIVRNEKLIKRNAQIGNYTLLIALAVLGAGMFISVRRSDLFAWSLVALVAGFVLTQVAMYYSTRFSRSPRPDEQLDAALKGLPGDTVIYHYMTPVPHVMVGSGGIWILEPRQQRGTVTYERNRWRLRGGGFMQSYMSIFGQEGLGRPDIDIAGDTESLKKFLSKRMDGAEVPPIQAALVFTNEAAEVDAPEAPAPTLRLKQLKEYMRQRVKERAIATPELQQVKAAIGGEETDEG